MGKTCYPVSDHAVLRYLERVCGVDIAAVRRTIYAETAPAIAQGAAGVMKDGVRYSIRSGWVTTLYEGRGLAVRRQHAVAEKKIMRKARNVPIKQEAAE